MDGNFGNLRLMRKDPVEYGAENYSKEIVNFTFI